MWGEKQQHRAYSPVSDNDESKSSAEMDEDRLLMGGHKSRQRRWPATWVIVLVTTACIAVYSFALVAITVKTMSMQRVYGNRFLDTPTNDYITYEPRVFLELQAQEEGVPYFPVKPNEESDHLWHEFFKGHNLALSPEYMRSIGREEQGVKLPDGNYMGIMMVYHHMHCLKNLYHALNPEYYGLGNMTADEQEEWDDHVVHCLHIIKDGLMCQADTTLVTMKWSIHGTTPTGNFSNPHECVNWDRLLEWSTPRVFDALANDVLVHPDLGPAFIDGVAQETDLPTGKHDYSKDPSNHQ